MSQPRSPDAAPHELPRAELWQPVREALAALAGSDPRRVRFGAAAHGYALRAPLGAARLEEIERAAQVRLPDDYRDFVLELGDGGAGPYYGLWPLDDPRQLETLRGPFVEPPPPGHRWRGVVALGHLGCGHVAFLVVDGARRGQVWLAATAAGVVTQIAPHFLGYYTAWLRALGDGHWPPGHVPPGVCPLAQGLSGYLAAVEARLGLAEGGLAGAPLSQALSALGPGSISLVSEHGASAMLPEQTPVAPCLVCEQLLLGLSEHGLDRAAVAPAPALPLPCPQAP